LADLLEYILGLKAPRNLPKPPKPKTKVTGEGLASTGLFANGELRQQKAFKYPIDLKPDELRSYSTGLRVWFNCSITNFIEFISTTAERF
jgi:hypothetical protein